MERTIRGHKVSLYSSLSDGFVFRIYDKKGYVHFVINFLKNYRDKRIWKDTQRNWNGDFLWGRK